MDRKYLDYRLKELDLYSEYYHRLELKTLCMVLLLDEKLNCILTGVYEGNRCLMAVTDYRIIIISSGVLKQGSVTIIKRSAVTSWNFNKKILLSSVSIVAENKTYTFSQTQMGREKLFNWAMEQPIKTFEE